MHRDEQYEDKDMVIPLFYKEEIIAYAPDDFDAKTFKFINEEGPKIFSDEEITLVSFHKPEDKTKLSHWYALDEHDVHLFQTGQAKWSDDA